MFVLIALLVAIVFLGLGFLSHVLWIGVLVGLLVAAVRLGRAGLNPSDPAGRMNINMLDAVGRYLVETTSRARSATTTPRPTVAAVPLMTQPVHVEPVPPSRPTSAPERWAAERSRRVTQAMLVGAGERLRVQLGREPTAAELAVHLGVPPQVILDAITVEDLARAGAFDPAHRDTPTGR